MQNANMKLAVAWGAKKLAVAESMSDQSILVFHHSSGQINYEDMKCILIQHSITAKCTCHTPEFDISLLKVDGYT